MNNKEKIKLLKEFIKGTEVSLPPELMTEVVLQANMLQINDKEGALTYMRELQREERDKEIVNIQKQQIIFTRILALATLLLGVTAFFNFFRFSLELDPTLAFIIGVFGAIGIVVLLITFVALLWDVIRIFFKKIKRI